MASYEELNTYLRACCIKDLNRSIETKTTTLAEDYEIEREFLKQLPQERFEVSEISAPIVDQKSRVKVKTNRYSVPASLIAAKVSVRTTPLEVEVSYQGRLVAAHERLHLRNQERLALDHYLELLLDKPGAFPGSKPLHQARERDEFSQDYEELWQRMRGRHGDKDGTRAFIEVLLLLRKHPREVVECAVDYALEVGTADPGTVALIATQIIAPPPREAAVIDVGELSRYDRPSSGVSAYDALLEEEA